MAHQHTRPCALSYALSGTGMKEVEQCSTFTESSKCR
ncbi:unnamed protein product, partial [Rotaria sp. Silwood2]